MLSPVDRREEFARRRWTQGRKPVGLVALMTTRQLALAAEVEACQAYCGDVLVYVYPTAETCREAVRQQNGQVWKAGHARRAA